MVASLWNRAIDYGQSLRSPAQTLNRTQSVRETQAGLATRYDFWRAVYGNEAYGDLSAAHQFGHVWTGYPKSLRPISLKPKEAVDWWVNHVYPGLWTRDGLPAPSGDPNRIPYTSDTPEELRLAVQQAFTWAGSGRLLSLFVHLGAMLGDVFAEVEVHYNEDGDPRSNKVYPVVQDPAHVVELSLNARGDVKSYRLAIPRYDEQRRREYLWGKVVTKTTITTYYDDDEYSYVDGQPASIPNRWGFVPAAWVPHRYIGGLHGAPVLDVIIATLAERDAAMAAVNDFIHRFVRQGALLSTKNPKDAQTYLWGARSGGTRSGYAEYDYAARVAGIAQDRQTINIWPVPEDATLHPIIQNLGLGEAESHIARLDREIDQALSETRFIDKMAEMDEVTGPGARALLTDERSSLNLIASNYDHGTVKIGQMCAAIGGQLIADGDWGLRSQLTPQQQKFAPFDLTSYARDELDFDLQPRELLPRTFGELADEAIKLEAVTTPEGLRHIGYSDEDIYGVTANGESLAPVPPPGILPQANSGVDAAGIDALTRQFAEGLGAA